MGASGGHRRARAQLSVGHSAAPDADVAARVAAACALHRAPSPAFALAFSTDQYDHPALARALTRELRGIPWAGCCTAGVFTGSTLLAHGLVVGVVSSREMRFGIGVAGPVSADGRTAGRGAVAAAIATLPPDQRLMHRAVILLPDALAGNGADVVRGAAEEAGAGVAWAGGGAGDHLRSTGTAQYANGVAHEDHVVAVVMESPNPFGTGMRHGWQPYGPPALVTRAQGSTVLELDYEPAFEAYRRAAQRHGESVTAGGFAHFAMSHPLGISQANGEHVIRDPLCVEAGGALRFEAEVPDGCLVRVMHGPRDTLLAAAREAAIDAREGTRGAIGGALVFDCVSRGQALGGDVAAEVAGIRRGVGDDVPLIGCLSLGEVGIAAGGGPQLHNKAAVLLGLPADRGGEVRA